MKEELEGTHRRQIEVNSPGGAERNLNHNNRCSCQNWNTALEPYH
jgi:hypothetical protein